MSDSLLARINRIERAREQQAALREEIEQADPDRWRWYDRSCPCGLPPGECSTHPRARESQRPPPGDWDKWLFMAGRGSGKTHATVEWLRWLVETQQARRIAIVACTAADCRETLAEGPSGILASSPPWFMPTYEPSRARIVWPNGAKAFFYSAEEPARLRGPQHDAALCDELAAWKRPETWSNLMFGLRMGSKPKVAIATTPKKVPLVREILADPGVIVTHGSTYDNRMHLAESFTQAIIARYEGTRLGDQEIHGMLVDVSSVAWFQQFDPKPGGRHVTESAEYDPMLPVYLAIDCGVSRFTGAVWFQVRQLSEYQHRVNVFADYFAEGLISDQNAAAIWKLGADRCGDHNIERVRCDPAATARTGIGVTAFSVYEKQFGPRRFAYWPRHEVVDGLEQLEILIGAEGREPGLIIHPRCHHLIAAFTDYRRAEQGGIILDRPADPQHDTGEDLMDAIRGGVRDAFPDGQKLPPKFRRVRLNSLF